MFSTLGYNEKLDIIKPFFSFFLILSNKMKKIYSPEMKCILRTDIDQVNLLQQTLAANDADVDEEALMQGGKGGATRKFGNNFL